MKLSKLTNWTTRSGNELLISEMTNDHIQKCIWMLTPKNPSGRFTNSICGLSLELANREIAESTKILKLKEIIKLHAFFDSKSKKNFVMYVMNLSSNPLILLELEKHYADGDQYIKQLIRDHKNYKNEASLVFDILNKKHDS
jgi:hypothetical protein